MFSALLKAFTGRAGLLAGLLALALVVVTAAAVYIKTPEIEQSLADSAMPVLQSTLVDSDDLTSFRAEGRNLMLEGRFDDPQGLAAELKSVEGVRSIFVNGADLSIGIASPAPVVEEAGLAQEEPPQTGAEIMQAAMETDQSAGEMAAASRQVEDEDAQIASTDKAYIAETGPPLEVTAETDAQPLDEAQPAVEEDAIETVGAEVTVAETSADDQAETAATEESLLRLRYDGTHLQLSGHMGDEQMARLVVDSVRRAVPRYSELEADVDSSGRASPLNWMSEFLAVVARLPADAQGVIIGSDSKGVEIIPDEEQKLLEQAEAQSETGTGATETAEVDPVPAVQAPVTAAPVVTEADQGSAPEVAATEGETPEAAVDNDLALEKGGELALETDTTNEAVDSVAAIHPGQYIVTLNKRLAAVPMFKAGEFAVGEALAAELDGLAEMLRQHPSLLLRIVGNIDFEADPRFAEFIGLDRARAARDYLYQQGIERRRVFARPLPRDYAFNKQVQLIFYISE